MLVHKHFFELICFTTFSHFNCKVNDFTLDYCKNWQLFFDFQSDPEEEASSDEEQLARNRFLYHTEIVVWALSFGASLNILRDAIWLRKTVRTKKNNWGGVNFTKKVC